MVAKLNLAQLACRTSWYPFWIAPAREGVYERYYTTRGGPLFCKYEGGRWHSPAISVRAASRMKEETCNPNLNWRGLCQPQ